MNKEDIHKMNTASCSICLISRANCATCPFHIYYAQAHPQETTAKDNTVSIWQMTESEYILSMKGKQIKHFYYNRHGQLIVNHKNAVIEAIESGKQVSMEVIKSMSYPLSEKLMQKLSS